MTMSTRDKLTAAGLVIVLIGLWELVCRAFTVRSYLFPAPSAIAESFVDNARLLGPATWVTTVEVVLGLLIALVAALGIALLLHASPTVRRGLYPLLIGSQTIPIVVLAPILVIAFGFDIGPKLVIVALTCFFPLVVATVDGLATVDPQLIRLMRTLDASRWTIFRRVELPTALPSVFSGARVAVTYAPIGAVFAEWSGSTGGLGYLMLQSTSQLRTALVFAAVIVLAAESITLFLLVTWLERVIITWKDKK
ncbi:ABC transporter permease [Pseudonocardiaceae bacterium YIM PH 21723]|nr:ABC transporter permease [Pseudonocardiaceae bacterium YIM PH 21723]